MRKILPLANKGMRAGMNLVFPPSCLICRAETAHCDPLICADCRGELLMPKGAFCTRCGQAASPSATEGSHCAHCRNLRFPFRAVIPLGNYEEALRSAVLRMKHFHEQPLAAAMGQLLAERLAESHVDPPPDMVTPIPIHWVRRLARGTNGPEVMCEVMARKLSVPAVPRLLRCRRQTKKQSLLPREQRRQNVRNAFRISPGHDLRGLHVVLVDDIVTTGATASEAAATLKRAGASQITVAVCARAIRQF